MDEAKILELQRKPRGEMTEYEIKLLEDYENTVGPLNLLQTAVRTRQQILISIRNDTKIIGRIKAFDRHCNMILEGAKLMWDKRVKNANGKWTTKPLERYMAKVFVRGDVVIMVVLVGQ